MNSKTEMLDRIRELERLAEELRSEIASLPVREPKVETAPPHTVYEFWPCDGTKRQLFLDHDEIASHMPGGEDEDKPVARIKINDESECWYLLAVAPDCRAGECAEILAWFESCDRCKPSIFTLVPCTTGDYRRRVRVVRVFFRGR
jgi:hypothetical protein